MKSTRPGLPIVGNGILVKTSTGEPILDDETGHPVPGERPECARDQLQRAVAMEERVLELEKKILERLKILERKA